MRQMQIELNWNSTSIINFMLAVVNCYGIKIPLKLTNDRLALQQIYARAKCKTTLVGKGVTNFKNDIIAPKLILVV